MTGELFVNGYDAETRWGISFESTAFSTLLTPAPMKGYVVNSSPLTDGKSVAPIVPCVDEREVQLPFILRASDISQFLQRYADFTEEISKGFIEIKTKYQPNVAYRFLYLSCSQFTQFNGRLAKFSLRLNEPNPANREDDND